MTGEEADVFLTLFTEKVLAVLESAFAQIFFLSTRRTLRGPAHNLGVSLQEVVTFLENFICGRRYVLLQP